MTKTPWAAQAQEMPASLNESYRTSAQSIADARKSLRAMLSAPEAWQRFCSDKVRALRLHAVEAPSARALSDFLCEMVPAEFMRPGGVPATAQAAAQAIAADLRMLKLRSAVIEAGLVEQLRADGSFAQGQAFSAEQLERSLDDWLRAGRHRGAAFDSAPLSEIDRMITRHAQAAEDGLHTRYGLVFPVAMAIHIWRELEQAPPELAQKVGWAGPLEGKGDAAGPVPVV